MVKNNILTKFFLALILVLAFFLRFVKLTEIPPSLNWDEVSIGYNAYSILKTGRDEWGEFFPLHFKSFGEYKLPVQIYASIPGIYFFGLNEFGLRITPAIYGVLTVLVCYFLGKKLFSKKVGIVSALLLGISPWHIQLTRASFESSFSVFWVVLGILWFLYGLEKPKYWILSSISFAIAVYTYNSARVFVPLFLVSLIFIYFKHFFKSKKQVFISGFVFALLMLPLLPFVLSGQAAARYKLVSITDEAGLVPRINENRGNSKLPKPFPRLIHNKLTYLSLYFTKNYIAHMSPDFLFLKGAGHRQHHVQGVGELYIIQLPFLVLGIAFLLKLKNKYKALLGSWVFLTFIPVATTQDSIPNALRTVIASPALQIVAAFGFLKVYELLGGDKTKKVLFGGLVGLVLLFSLFKYLNLYFNIYPTLYSRDWQYGNKQVVQYIKENYDNYDLIVYSRTYGEPHIFTLFYLAWDPGAFMNDPKLNRFESFDWIRVLSFDKFYFPDLGDDGTRYQNVLEENPGKKILFIGRSGDFPGKTEKKKEVYFLNGTKAFEIVEYQPQMPQ